MMSKMHTGIQSFKANPQGVTTTPFNLGLIQRLNSQPQVSAIPAPPVQDTYVQPATPQAVGFAPAQDTTIAANPLATPAKKKGSPAIWSLAGAAAVAIVGIVGAKKGLFTGKALAEANQGFAHEKQNLAEEFSKALEAAGKKIDELKELITSQQKKVDDCVEKTDKLFGEQGDLIAKINEMESKVEGLADTSKQKLASDIPNVNAAEVKKNLTNPEVVSEAPKAVSPSKAAVEMLQKGSHESFILGRVDRAEIASLLKSAKTPEERLPLVIQHLEKKGILAEARNNAFRQRETQSVTKKFNKWVQDVLAINPEEIKANQKPAQKLLAFSFNKDWKAFRDYIFPRLDAEVNVPTVGELSESIKKAMTPVDIKVANYPKLNKEHEDFKINLFNSGYVKFLIENIPEIKKAEPAQQFEKLQEKIAKTPDLVDKLLIKHLFTEYITKLQQKLRPMDEAGRAEVLNGWMDELTNTYGQTDSGIRNVVSESAKVAAQQLVG